MAQRRKAPRPTAEFRVSPDLPSRLYVKVTIMATRDDVRAYIRSTGCDPGRHCVAMFRSYTIRRYRKKGRSRTSSEFGEVILPVTDLNSEVIPHECGHAALAWAQRRKVDVHDTSGKRITMDRDCGQERFCYVLGRLVNEIAKQCRIRKLV